MRRAAGKAAPLFFVGMLALTWSLPVGAVQKVALPNGEVLHLGDKGGLNPQHSTDIMKKELGPRSILWRVLMGVPFIWDSGDKEVVFSWMNSRDGQAQIKGWMTKGDTHGTVFHNADVILKNYFEIHSK